MNQPFTIERPAGGGKAFARGLGMLVLAVIAVLIAASSPSCIRTGHVGVVSWIARKRRPSTRRWGRRTPTSC